MANKLKVSHCQYRSTKLVFGLKLDLKWDGFDFALKLMKWDNTYFMMHDYK